MKPFLFNEIKKKKFFSFGYINPFLTSQNFSTDWRYFLELFEVAIYLRIRRI